MLAALGLLVLPLGFVQVSALDDNPDTPVSNTSQSDDGALSDESDVSKTEVRQRLKDARESAAKRVEAERESKKEQTKERRKNLCENRVKSINNKVQAYTKAGTTQLNHLNTVYDKLKNFQSSNAVEVANFAELSADADAKQQVAVDAVAALQSVAADVDCSDPDVAVTLGTIKEAAKAAKTALREYRASLHDILVALAQAVDSTDETSTEDTGGTES